LSGVQNALGVKKCFAGAWRLLTIWSRLEQPSRAPPLPEGVALAMSGVCLSIARQDAALCILLGFYGLLRTAEVFGIRACHVSWNHDLSRAILTLPRTKAGLRRGWTETVIFSDPTLLCFLHAIWKLRAPHEPLLEMPGQKFRLLWKWICSVLKLENLHFSPYSLRRGGATQMWTATADITRVMMYGRWDSVKTARIYVVDGQQELTAMQLHPIAKQKCGQFAQMLKSCF